MLFCPIDVYAIVSSYREIKILKCEKNFKD